MIIFVIIIAAIVVWYCISAEKERIAKQKAQQNQKKVQDELAAKVKEAEALIPRVVSSDFYKKVLSYIQSEIFKRDEAIRHQVEQDYDIYLRSSHGEESFFSPNYSRYNRGSFIRISHSYIYGFFVDSEFYPPNIIFSSWGYSNLTNAQLYALLQSVCHDFDSLELYDFDSISLFDDNRGYPKHPLQINQFQSDIFNDERKNNTGIFYFYLTDKHIVSVVDSEIRHLQGQKSPYKNAF